MGPRSGALAPATNFAPPESEILTAAEIINAGQKVTFLVGHGANGATDEVLAAARPAGAGIITALRGKQVVPSDVSYCSQQLGLLGSLPSLHQISDCDTLVMPGTNYPCGQFLPETGQARAIQVDMKREQRGL